VGKRKKKMVLSGRVALNGRGKRRVVGRQGGEKERNKAAALLLSGGKGGRFVRIAQKRKRMTF